MTRTNFLDVLLFSLLAHGVVLVLLSSPEVNTSGAEKISVEIREVNTSTKDKTPQKPLKPPTPDKYAKPGEGVGGNSENEKIDLTEYSNQIKILVDPVWISNVNPYLGERFSVEVLIKTDATGNITQIQILSSTGNPKFRELVVKTFNEIGHFPTPPNVVVREGIIWSFAG